MKPLSRSVVRIVPMAALLAGLAVPALAQSATSQSATPQSATSGQGPLVSTREGNRSNHQAWQPAQGPVHQQEKQAGIALSPQQAQAQDRELGRIAGQLTGGKQSTVTGPSGAGTR